MKIQVIKENLAKAIQLATKYTSSKAQVPILSYLLLSAEETGIFVTATNLDVSVRVRLPGKIVASGRVVVPAKILNELVQTLGAGNVNLDSETGSELIVLAGRVRAKLQTLAAEEFPPFPELPTVVGKLRVEDFQKAFSRVSFSVATDESRPILTGFLWQWKTGTVVSTDGYRLSMLADKKVFGVDGGGDETVIAPGKVVEQLLTTFADLKEDEVAFGYVKEGQQLALLGNDCVAVVRVLAGDYPKYEGILPQGAEVELLVDREQLLGAVRSAAIFARDSANIVRLTIKTDSLEVSANATQVGENTAGVEVEFVKPGTGSIAFNGKYLIDFLAHAESERIRFGMTDPLKASLFQEEGRKDYRHVIMPVRVRE